MTWAVVGRVIAAALVLGLAGAALWVRLAPVDAAAWHVDPLTAPDPATPNFARIAPGTITGTGLAERAAAAMLAMPRTRLIAGSAAAGWMTFETRSRIVGYPDYTSIRVLPDPAGGETLAALARSRFGVSDLGVNAARLAALRAALAGT
ncbi:MAG: DUF1499 domain-containing protein [Gemmobacter sp.]